MHNEHSVSTHLRLNTAEYDRIIRTYIPYYDESRGVQLDLLAAAVGQREKRVIDLGGGTASLAESILQRFPHCSVIVRDIDGEMLALARGRLARFEGRYEVECASFADRLAETDAVMAAFALHHILDFAEKIDVYRRIREALRPSGVFLNTDAVSGPFWDQAREEWAAFMATQGFTLEQAYQNLTDWSAEDRYFSVHEECDAMMRAGFEAPECLWRRGPIAILGARV